MKLFLAAVLSLVLVACATAPTDPAQAVYQMKSNYAAALTVAVAYKNLPPCGANVTVTTTDNVTRTQRAILCSDQKIVAQLQHADDVAWPALQAAENTARTPGAGANAQTAIVAARQAVQALLAITATLQVK